MGASTFGRIQRTHRELVAWFSSPRVAVHAAFRLTDMVPTTRVRIRVTEEHGAEGPVVALTAEIPWLWSTMVRRQLDGLGVPVLWDPGSDGTEAATGSAA